MEPPVARLVIVRRGAPELFQVLRARYADDPTTAVIWDRRIIEDRRRTVRKVSVERRRGPRRFSVDSTAILNTRGFFVARAVRAPVPASSLD
ncbi:MAG TPA: hypothetical protein VGW35_16200 [Methylomirabilota bacterium]|jgi:predicted pyridoxine 5'-phosphate oxidase superfamily flavin-nucleotide-binding protein|nr:hypothetical protein [Methylomirabilota bacterium]